MFCCFPKSNGITIVTQAGDKGKPLIEVMVPT